MIDLPGTRCYRCHRKACAGDICADEYDQCEHGYRYGEGCPICDAPPEPEGIPLHLMLDIPEAWAA